MNSLFGPQDPNKPVFVMLVGLPGSGKSTFRERLVEQGEVVVISSDDIIERECAKVGKTYSEGFSDFVGVASKEMQEIFHAAIKEGKPIIWDQTNLSPKKRKGTLSQVPSMYNKICLVIEVPNDIRQERLKNRPGKVIPKHVDESMMANFVMPTSDEGWDIITIVPGQGFKELGEI